jgi:hypothetical protein
MHNRSSSDTRAKSQTRLSEIYPSKKKYHQVFSTKKFTSIATFSVKIRLKRTTRTPISKILSEKEKVA